MLRFLAGVIAAVLLMSAGVLAWRAQADRGQPLIPPAPGVAATSPLTGSEPPPPEATERTREEKRFARYDRDRNGAVGRDEYLASRQKAFAKLDVNGDGKLGFDEYAVKTIAKFTGADRDHTSTLNSVEFATTRVIRKAKPTCRCAPMPAAQPENASEEEPG